jgi:Polymerase beta, Nucleotidyltransferase
MRLTQEQIIFFKEYVPKYSFGGVPYLFGSRTDDKQKGGDIDIAIVSTTKPHHSQIFEFKNLFYKKFGVQKLDVKCFITTENSAFKNYIFSYAIKL